MKTEPKFRIWDGIKMITADYPFIGAGSGAISPLINLLGQIEFVSPYNLGHEPTTPNGLILMICSGVKDKNGTSIYDGDIIHVDGDKNYAKCKPEPNIGDYVGIFEVKQVFGSWGMEFEWEPISGYECSTHIMGDLDSDGRYQNITILGNIYTNWKKV